MRPAAIQNNSIVGDIVNKIAARAGPIMYAIRDMLFVHPMQVPLRLVGKISGT